MFPINAFYVNYIIDTSMSEFNHSLQATHRGVTSESAPVVSGVPQGFVLGVLLSIFFIYHLPDNLTSRTGFFAYNYIV